MINPADPSPPIDYFLDLDRKLYHHYGMYTARFWDLWGPRTWLSYLRLIRKGERLQKSDGAIDQRGGDVVIDPDGIIRVHHIGTGPGDRPEISMVLKKIEFGF